MAAPITKTELEERVLENLGAPVIQVNIAPIQLSNAVDDAVEFWSEFHVDGQDNTYLKVKLTQDDLDNGYIELPESVFAVLDIIDAGYRSSTWMSYEYALMKDTVMNVTMSGGSGSGGLSSLVIAKSYLEDVKSVFTPEPVFDFSFHKHRLHILDLSKHSVDDILILEVMGYIYKDSYNVWGDRSLRRLATAYAKKIWGMNLKKFSGVTLPSGTTLNGDAIYSDASQEIQEMEEYIEGQQGPVGIVLG